ncbi:hypothetical protein MNBD_ALPHA12-1445 [hydrothermal vent metagenome]|uniref:ABC transporter permease n=1 Tax=hydrothermal vent metagenome TaxID=652676 RepID=A0A3B0UU10_9ZZZZ
MLASLAWRNIWRQPVRSILSLIGLAFTSMLLVFMLSFQFGVYDTMKTGALGLFDGFGQFQPPGYKDDPDISKTMPDISSLEQQITAIGAISAVTARASSFAILANGERSFAAAIIGVDPARETKVSNLATTVSKGRYLKAGDSNAIVLGVRLARNLGLELGDRVTMLGTGRNGAVAADVLTLVGIFDTGIAQMDRQIAQMPLARFQFDYNLLNSANIVALRGNKLSDVVAAEPALRALAAKNGVTYLNWRELQPALSQMITLDFSTSVLMYATLVIVVVFILLNTLYMSVLERTREFGGLMAIGMRPAQIGAMAWLELIFLSFLGSAIGIALGAAVALYFQHSGIQFEGMDEIFAQWGASGLLYPRLSLLSAFAGPGIVVASIALLGFIPFRHILGLEPVSAMAAA